MVSKVTMNINCFPEIMYANSNFVFLWLKFIYKLEDRLQKKKDNVFAQQKQSVPKRILR